MPKILTKKKLLSCKYCREKKIKCDYQVPCSNCISHGITCEPVLYDRRKNKFGNSYISALENQIKTLETLLLKLKYADSKQRDELLEKYTAMPTDLKLTHSNLERIVNPSPIVTPKNVAENKEYTAFVNQSNVIVENPKSGQISVYGQPSVFIPLHEHKSENHTDLSDFESFHYSTIFIYISNFFKWYYPDNNVYIHRESFLTDFFREKNDIKKSLPYCSEELIYAICACGSNIDFGEHPVILEGELYDTPDKFYCKSRDMLFKKMTNDSCNSVTAIQSFLCLAFFDLGRGRTLSAWILSGIAFRIGLHMGFSQDPTKWKNINHPLTDYDVKVKSRIYWGCCIADHIISLVLGRSPLLKDSHATIPESEDLPVLPGIEYFMYIDPNSNPNPSVSVPLKQQTFLYKLASKFQKKCFSPRSETGNKLTNLEMLDQLSAFNLELLRWKDSLAESLSWTKLELRDNSYNPHKMSLRYQYYLLLLSFNRPFILDNNPQLRELTVSPIAICAGVIDDVYYSIVCFKNQNSLKFASLNIVFLSILSISILQKFPSTIRLPLKKSTLISFFGSVLQECSDTWEIAKRGYETFLPLFDKNVRKSQISLSNNILPVSETDFFDESAIFDNIFEFELCDLESCLP